MVLLQRVGRNIHGARRRPTVFAVPIIRVLSSATGCPGILFYFVRGCFKL